MIQIVSIVLTLAASASGIAISTLDHSLSVLSYGLENLIDVITSSIILWRLRDASVVTVEVSGRWAAYESSESCICIG